MPFTIIRQGITKMKVGAIVNASNTEFAMGGNVCGAIFNEAGAAQLQVACDKLAPINMCEAVIMLGFGLPPLLDNLVVNPDEPFSAMLLRLIDANDKTLKEFESSENRELKQ